MSRPMTTLAALALTLAFVVAPALAARAVAPALAPLAPVDAAPAKPRVALEHALVLKVADRDAAADSLIALVEKRHGYFAERTDDTVRLKVPLAALTVMLAEIEPLGMVLSRTSQARDLGSTLDEQRTRLRSREQMLARYFGVLANADSRSVVTVEQHMTQLVESIETLKGSLRLLEHQLQYANVVVSFRFRERQAPTYNATSSFPWLNDVSLDRLQQEFARD